MKRRILGIVGVSAVAALVSLSAPGQMAMEYCCPEIPEYDIEKEVTVQATITEVFEHQGNKGWVGVHLKTETGAEILEVHVGPALYLLEKQFSFEAGDTVEITGSKVSVEGGEMLIARIIRLDGRILRLRNQAGVPEWSRGRLD